MNKKHCRTKLLRTVAIYGGIANGLWRATRRLRGSEYFPFEILIVSFIVLCFA